MMNEPRVICRIQASTALRALCVAACILSSAVASAGGFYLRYDAAKSYPEQDGWTRSLYDPEGGLVRTLEDGALVLDTRASLLTSDVYSIRSDMLTPAPGEVLRVTWRAEATFSSAELGFSEVAVIVVSGDLRYAEFNIGPDFIADTRYVSDDPTLIAPVAPGAFHTFSLESGTLHDYQLYVDGQLAFGSTFHGQALGLGPRVAFGDSLIGGVTSVAAWNFVEVAVTPDASTSSLFVAAIALSAIRRNITCLK